MNLSFHIQANNINTSNAALYVELDAQGLSYIILDNGICLALAVYHFNEATTDETAAEQIHQIIAAQPFLKQMFSKVHIIYGYAPSILVPLKFSDGDDNKAMLELLYGDVSERIFRADIMDSVAATNVYGIPTVIEQAISRYFLQAQYLHLFSLLPAVVKAAGNYMYCIFNTGQLKVLLMKGDKLQVMQNYFYKTPQDVAYRLLDICKSFEVDVNETTVHLSGMIDANSVLYIELYKYFPQLQFEPLPQQYQYPDGINQYPAHYFSHLFAIASCV